MTLSFDVQNPGPKEFAIVGIGAVGALFAWDWWQKRHGSSQPAAATGAETPQAYEGTTPTGLGLGALLLWIQDHNSSSTTTTTTRRTTTPTGPAKPMPNVIGQRANFAEGLLKSGYGVIADTRPARNPDREYIVTGQTPPPGVIVRAGDRATLRVKQIAASKAAGTEASSV